MKWLKALQSITLSPRDESPTRSISSFQSSMSSASLSSTSTDHHVSTEGDKGIGRGGRNGLSCHDDDDQQPDHHPDVDYPSMASSSYSGSAIIRQPTSITVRTKEIRLVRDASANSDGFGIALRGGCVDTAATGKNGSRPFVIGHVKANSPAERDGTVQIGDRILSVNNRPLAGCSLVQVQKWMRETGDKLTMVIEYDVAVVDRSLYAQHSPLLVEVEKSPGALLGIHLVMTGPSYIGYRHHPCGGAVIESVASGSIAERCGALHPGDCILAVGDVRCDGVDIDLREVARLLQNHHGDVVKLIVAPAGMAASRRSSDQGSRQRLPPPSPRPSQTGTLRSGRSGRTAKSRLQRSDTASLASSSGQSAGSVKVAPPLLLSHPEWVTVTLQIDCRGSYGLALGRASGHDSPVVINVESASPCDRAGCIQPGDRILRINQQSTAGMTLDQVVDWMRESKPRMNLDVEFDVADCVVPASGVYWLKLVKPAGCASSFGISFHPADVKGERPGDGSLAVSGVLPGSVAHRTGSVRPGDRLLAINNNRIESMSMEEVVQSLHHEQIVRLKLDRSGPMATDMAGHLPCGLVYTVELVRHGGPLGITISGTENPNDPITISALTDGGLAERTGALHIGDRLLAINGRPLQGKLLAEAIEILQNSGDVVTLKIGKSGAKIMNSSGELERDDYLPMKLPPLPSIDSAVESWISGASHHRSCPSAGTATNPHHNNNNHQNMNSHENHMNNMNESTQPTPIYTAESATVRRRQNNSRSVDQWDVLSSPSVDSGQFDVQCNVIVHANATTVSAPAGQAEQPEQPVIRMSDLALVQRCNTLPRNNYRKLGHPQPHRPDATDSNNSTTTATTTTTSPIYCLAPAFPGGQLPSNLEIHQVTLHKDSVYEDFGFSVSDGLYERGIYVNRVRKGGPADLSGLLQAFDRILQVNDTRTFDFDCCLTVPLIAAAGDTIALVVGRHPHSVHLDLKENAINGLQWDEEEEDEDAVIPADADDVATSSVFVGVRTITTTL